MPKLTKIYTRTGDAGATALGGGQRVPKDHLRVQVYGTVDEANAHLGLAVAAGVCDRLTQVLPAIQNQLFDLGSTLCFLEEDKAKWNLPQIEERHVAALEELMDELTAAVGPLENFILPGGTVAAGHLHVARTVCRRAEREATTLARQDAVNPVALRYLNRLSDALFVMARYDNFAKGVAEPLWQPGK